MKPPFAPRSGKRFAFFFILAPLFLFGVTAIVMLLWNNLLPEILGVKAITYWQAMGLLVLSKILFGGFGGPSRKPPFGGRPLREKWMNMSEEERLKFKEEWQKRC